MTALVLQPLGLTIELAISGLAGLAAFATVLGVWYGLLEARPNLRRAKAIAGHRLALRAGRLAPRRRGETLQPLPVMRRVVTRLDLMRHAQTEAVARRLAQAGWRTKDAVVRYLFAKLALPFALGGLVLFLTFGVGFWALTPGQNLVASLAATLAGFYLPGLYVRNAKSKRQDLIRKALPDTLDLMVICAEAGLSLDAALKRVGDEMMQAAPEMAEELGLTAVELGFLPERRKALENLADRTDMAGVRALVTTLMQAERYGTPLAHSLRVLSAEFRAERLARAEEKAARLPAMMTVPMILFILPPLFVVLIGPAVLDVMDAMRQFI